MSQTRIKPVLLFTALLACVAYFSYHGFYGKRGFFTHEELRRQHVALSQEHEQLREQRMHWEKRVRALRTESLDVDLLDEQARLLFHYANDDEIIVFDDMTR